MMFMYSCSDREACSKTSKLTNRDVDMYFISIAE